MADDIRELNALIADYGREFQSPDPRRGPSLGSSRLYADYQPATSSEQAEMLLSMLPGIGEGLDVANLVQDLGNRKYGQAGLSGLAMVLPGVGAATIKKIGKEGLSGGFYRGSSNLDELTGKYSLPKEGTLGGGGVYVTQKPDYASNYAAQTALGEPKTGGFVAPLNVKFDNPLIIDIKAQEVAPEFKVLKALGLSDDKADDILERAYEETGGLTNQISSRAKKQGFDGIVLRNEDGTIQEAISYNPKNIRSVFEEVVEKSRVSIFPKPERMFDEGSRPSGGEYIDPKTNDVLTGKNISSANISVKEGRPAFTGIADDVAEVGSSGKGTFKTKTNLFKKSAGWKWMDGPEEYADLPTLVSVQQKGKHYYTVDADFPAGVNLTRYADSPSEPRLRPTLQAQPVELGDVIGTISVRGKEHPVYNRIVAKAAGGLVQRNPYNYEPKAI